MGKYSDLALVFLRASIGVIFILHGVAKLGLWQAAPESMSGTMVIIMKTLSIVEPLMGAAIILGLMTSWASIVLAITMLGAIYFKVFVFKSGFIGQRGTGWEFDLILLAGLLILITVGGGRYALDKILCKEKSPLMPPTPTAL